MGSALDFCACNNLVVTNTLFKHYPCHQMTRYNPAQSTNKGHMIDYVLINRLFSSSFLDTRVYRGTYLHSDHMLVVSKLRFKLKAKRQHSKSRPSFQLNIKKLCDSDVSAFQCDLNMALEQVEEVSNPDTAVLGLL